MTYRARWHDADYDASPELRSGRLWMRLRSAEPAPGFEEVRPSRYVRAVPADECAMACSVAVVCRWRGAPFRVHDQREGELLLEYTGGRVTVAQSLGLDRVERGVYRRWVARDEVSDLAEHVTLLDEEARGV
ncbi:hypothetical protein [Actinoallomurus sp. CA-142502]|uniref:hypothetical protein n=1 Tax=Actinoallomurus sp. CA-142502 TaxID=3239885 RepID=UPI003D8DBFD6